MTISSTTAARHGLNLLTSLGTLSRSECGPGHTGSNQWELVSGGASLADRNEPSVRKNAETGNAGASTSETPGAMAPTSSARTKSSGPRRPRLTSLFPQKCITTDALQTLVALRINVLHLHCSIAVTNARMALQLLGQAHDPVQKARPGRGVRYSSAIDVAGCGTAMHSQPPRWRGGGHLQTIRCC